MVLHGWGGNGRDVELLAHALRIANLRYIIPEGEYDVPGTGGLGKGWYSLPLDEKAHRERISSRKKICKILDNLTEAGTPADRVVMMGFSQGASMSLDVALNYRAVGGGNDSGRKQRIAGVVSLSGFLLDAEEIPRRTDLDTDIPIFAGHGTFDPLIPLQEAKASIMSLTKAGFSVEFKEYPFDHRVGIEELEDVRAFLTRLFPI